MAKNKAFIITEVRGPFAHETKDGREQIKICLNGANGEAVFLTDKQVKAKTNVCSNFDVLEGLECVPTYFEVGDELKNGEKCNKENHILKDCKITKSARQKAIAEAAVFGASLDISKF